MSWQSMTFELTGQTPTPGRFIKTLVNRAWMQVQRDFMWSFLYAVDIPIPTPSPTSAGTVTTVGGSPTVVGDAAAAAAWQTFGLVNPITVRQFRVGIGTPYNIVAFDGTDTITLDRPYVDPQPGPNTGYTILQMFYNAPFQDFLWWDSFTDPVSGYPIGTIKTRQEVDIIDPQRFMSGWPLDVIPYQVNQTRDANGNPTNFTGYPMYEVWPAPLNNYTYLGACTRRGMPFQKMTDTVPLPLQEDIVIAKAKYYSYEWCVANPDKVPKADYRYLMGAMERQYRDLLNQYMISDEEYSKRHLIPSGQVINRPDLPWVSQRESVMYMP